MKLELRQDGWFEAGKDAKESFPFAYRIYLSKQEIKKSLETLAKNIAAGKIKTAIELEDTIRTAFPENIPHFKGQPYLRGNDVLIDTKGLPGEAYLGCVVS